MTEGALSVFMVEAGEGRTIPEPRAGGGDGWYFEVSAAWEGRDVALFSSTAVALGFGHSADINQPSRRLVGVSPALAVSMDR